MGKLQILSTINGAIHVLHNFTEWFLWNYVWIFCHCLHSPAIGGVMVLLEDKPRVLPESVWTKCLLYVQRSPSLYEIRRLCWIGFLVLVKECSLICLLISKDWFQSVKKYELECAKIQFLSFDSNWWLKSKLNTPGIFHNSSHGFALWMPFVVFMDYLTPLMYFIITKLQNSGMGFAIWMPFVTFMVYWTLHVFYYGKASS